MPSPANPMLAAQAQALIKAQVWRADSLGHNSQPCLPSGFAELDALLPGAGWPSHALSEILQPPQSQLEWRLLGPALRGLSGQLQGRSLLLINPPHTPHLPGLLACGLAPEQIIWVRAGHPQQQLWATEQAIKAHVAAAVLAWLPQARPEQIRRLQSHAQGSAAPVFVLRPLATQTQPSAAPLRLALSPGPDWCLRVHILKRRGPAHAQALHLPALPAGLAALLTPRMLAQPWPQPANKPAVVENKHALARPAQPAFTH